MARRQNRICENLATSVKEVPPILLREFMPCVDPSERMHAEAQTVAICVATYRRPDQLNRLLTSLGALTLAKNADVKILIVDNDAGESARLICEVVELRWPLRYIVEPRRGIAQARNTAVRHSAGANWIAFVDDDEMVEPQWLEHLLLTQLRFQADIVAGPVVPQFGTNVPEWIIQSGLHERPRYLTGCKPKPPGTGNVLISAEVFQRIGSFDERFGLTGGEDTQFFLRAAQAGFKAVWCDEAVVHESVGPDRTGLSYLLRREYRDASSMARIEVSRDPEAITYVTRAAKAMVRITQGAITLPLAPLGGPSPIARALMRICTGVGMLGGLMAITFEPYHNPESAP
jgi:succinoglycan biosynthesis protein ExoM